METQMEFLREQAQESWLFRDRRRAGIELAQALKDKVHKNALVFALPRGGVPVGYEVATALDLPLDIFLVRKLRTPGHGELAMGAVASNGVRIINNGVIRKLGVSPRELDHAIAEHEQELSQQELLYGQSWFVSDFHHHSVILIDDGLATGASLFAAVEAIKVKKPKRLMVAVPVGSVEGCEQIEDQVDELICLHTPDPFISVGVWYEDFTQTSDEEVRQLLENSKKVHH